MVDPMTGPNNDDGVLEGIVLEESVFSLSGELVVDDNNSEVLLLFLWFISFPIWFVESKMLYKIM